MIKTRSIRCLEFGRGRVVHFILRSFRISGASTNQTTEIPIGIDSLNELKTYEIGKASARKSITQRIGVIGYGDSWLGHNREDSSGLRTAILDGQCNLIELGSNKDKNNSWEMDVIKELITANKIKRDDLVLMSTISSSDLSIEDSLSLARIYAQFEKILDLHGLSRIDVLNIEVPQHFQRNDNILSTEEHRVSLKAFISKIMANFVSKELFETGRIGAFGFSWVNTSPYAAYGNVPSDLKYIHSCPLADVISCRNEILHKKIPLVVKFPIGIASACSRLYLGDRGFLLPKNENVFQIGTRVTHTERMDTQGPFTFINSAISFMQVPNAKAILDLKVAFNKAMHMEKLYMDTLAPFVENISIPEHSVNWAHILAHTQHKLEGYDEWLRFKILRIEPSLNTAVQALMGFKQTKEWASLYKHCMRQLLWQFTEMLEYNKATALEKLVEDMDLLAPSLSVLPKEDVMARCISAVLSTGVDAVLSQSYLSQGNMADKSFINVPNKELVNLMHNLELPPSHAVPEQN